MTAVYALYPDPDSAQLAVDGLRAAGVSEADITVISSEPYEHHQFSHRDRPIGTFRIAALGGAMGLGAGYWLTSTTERAWPLATGGMSIVTPWPNLVIMFELTMLGAIVSTVVTLLISAKLPRRLPALYDPEVSNGKILVGVSNPAGVAVPNLERALRVRSGVQPKTIP